MHLSEILGLNQVGCAVVAASKKRALEELSRLIAQSDPKINSIDVFDSLIARERLGSTGLGRGIAIPHGRFKALDKTVAAFIQLSKGVDYDAPDREPVDLICALLVPPQSTEEHLQILAELTEMFRNPEFRQKLRASKDATNLHQLLVNGLS